MRTIARFRTSSALWSAPFALAVIVFYFVIEKDQADQFYSSLEFQYAPLTVSQALQDAPSITYAITGALSAWEAGRLKRDGVWGLGASRRRARVAADTLTPVLVLAWMMIGVPTVVALIIRGTAPSWGIVPIVLLPMVVSVAAAVIGYVAGATVSRLISAPLVGLAVYYLVGFSASSPTFWKRHISGQFPVELEYGEQVTAISLLPHVLTPFSIALGLVLLTWVHRRVPRLVTAATGLVVLVAGPLISYLVVKGWDHQPPLSAGHVATACSAGPATVCGPDSTEVDLRAESRAVNETLSTLSTAGMPVTVPRTVVDGIVDTAPPSPTEQTWYVNLYTARTARNQAWNTMRTALDATAGCRWNGSDSYASLILWGASTIGQEDRYTSARSNEVFDTADDQLSRIRPVVTEVREESASAQAAWFRRTARVACREGSR